MRLGAHVSAAGGISRSPSNASAIAADGMQVFTRNQRRWIAPPLSHGEIESFFVEREKAGITPVLSHCAYLINLATGDEAVLEKSRAALTDELERASSLKLDAVVLHPGSHKGDGLEVGLKRLAVELDRAIEALRGRCPPIALETTSGQGHGIGGELGQLRDVIGRSRYPDRLAVCVGTCHVFAAGYDLSTEEGYLVFIDELERTVGCSRVAAWHLNDSRHEIGSHRDHHAKLGEGAIGLEAIRRVADDTLWSSTPGVLETPGGPENWKVEIELLRGLRAERPPPRPA